MEGFEQIGGADDEDPDWEREGSVSPASYTDDVDQLLESFRSERERASGELSVLTHNPRMMEVCQQLRERDANIINLEAKVMELDRQVIDLQVSGWTILDLDRIYIFLFLPIGHFK